jgi:hypothetical protein
MALDSNAIWNALKARLESNVSGFVKISRQRRDWGLEQHPVLMVLDDQGDESLIGDPDDPSPAWRITGELILLVQNKAPESPGDEFPALLNDLKTSVLAALERQPSEAIGNGLSYYTDLDGLVRVLSVQRIEKGTGDKVGQAVVRISLEMQTNPP